MVEIASEKKRRQKPCVLVSLLRKCPGKMLGREAVSGIDLDRSAPLLDRLGGPAQLGECYAVVGARVAERRIDSQSFFVVRAVVVVFACSPFLRLPCDVELEIPDSMSSWVWPCQTPFALDEAA